MEEAKVLLDVMEDMIGIARCAGMPTHEDGLLTAKRQTIAEIDQSMVCCPKTANDFGQISLVADGGAVKTVAKVFPIKEIT